SLFYWSPSQVNALLPAKVSTGAVTIALRQAGGPGGADVPAGSAIANVQTQAPGMFVDPTTDCTILGAGCATQLIRAIITDASGQLINSRNPARSGQSMVIWLTGLGLSATAP